MNKLMEVLGTLVLLLYGLYCYTTYQNKNKLFEMWQETSINEGRAVIVKKVVSNGGLMPMAIVNAYADTAARCIVRYYTNRMTSDDIFVKAISFGYVDPSSKIEMSKEEVDVCVTQANIAAGVTGLGQFFDLFKDRN